MKFRIHSLAKSLYWKCIMRRSVAVSVDRRNVFSSFNVCWNTPEKKSYLSSHTTCAKPSVWCNVCYYNDSAWHTEMMKNRRHVCCFPHRVLLFSGVFSVPTNRCNNGLFSEGLSQKLSLQMCHSVRYSMKHLSSFAMSVNTFRHYLSALKSSPACVNCEMMLKWRICQRVRAWVTCAFLTCVGRLSVSLSLKWRVF